MTVNYPTGTIFGKPAGEFVQPGPAKTWTGGGDSSGAGAAGASTGTVPASTGTVSSTGATNNTNANPGRFIGGPVGPVTGGGVSLTGDTDPGAPDSGSTGGAGAGGSRGGLRPWKWPWGRGRTDGTGVGNGTGEGHMASGIPVSESHASVPESEARKAADSNFEKEAEKFKEMGGFPMDPSTGDPANNAVGDIKPESHDTDPLGGGHR